MERAWAHLKMINPYFGIDEYPLAVTICRVGSKIDRSARQQTLDQSKSIAPIPLANP
jgi:hypothetical protein